MSAKDQTLRAHMTVHDAKEAIAFYAKAFRNEFIARNRDATRALLEHCIADKAIEAPEDMEVTLDLVFGPLFYRLLMGHAPITRGFVDQLMDAVIRARG